MGGTIPLSRHHILCFFVQVILEKHTHTHTLECIYPLVLKLAFASVSDPDGER